MGTRLQNAHETAECQQCVVHCIAQLPAWPHPALGAAAACCGVPAPGNFQSGNLEKLIDKPIDAGHLHVYYECTAGAL